MQIKQLLLLLVLLLTTNNSIAFNTNIYCSIQGYLYYDGHNVELSRIDTCNIETSIDKNKIWLISDLHYVVIDIPNNIRGFVNFRYNWGDNKFYLNNKVYDVDWHFLLRG